MINYSGKNKVKTAIFVSGSGTNLKNLLKFSKKLNSPISINLVISNNIKSKGFLFAKKNKISTVFYNFNNNKNYEILLSKLIAPNLPGGLTALRVAIRPSLLWWSNSLFKLISDKPSP